jgi:two-component system sensor histidine kinase/response regulator
MPRILVIEDEQYLLEDILELLHYESFTPQGARDGIQGVEMALQDPPDLILCDIMMPGMDGYQVLEHLRADARTATVPFIFLTAKSDRASLRQGMELGADDYITKPFSSAELSDAITARLRRQHTLIAEAEARLDHLKRQLARMVTHELRTPLISMSTVVEIVSRQMHSMTPTELGELLAALDAGNKRLSHRVEQLAFITQLETGMLTSELIAESGIAVSIWELLVASTNLARRFAYIQQPNVGIKLQDHDREALVLCSPPALKQALAELIANALTFAPENTDVHVEQWCSDDNLWVSVTDRGRGIPENKLKAALEAFQQIDREHHEQQGIGMGLTLAHRIITAHGGSLNLRSVTNKGTQVIVNLPLAV